MENPFIGKGESVNDPSGMLTAARPGVPAGIAAVALAAGWASLSPSSTIPGQVQAGEVDGAQSGQLLVVDKSGHSLSVLDVESGNEIARDPTGHPPHEVALSPDGDRAYVTDYGSADRPGNTITVIGVERAEPVDTLSLGRHTRPHGIDVAEDGMAWVTGRSR